MGDINVGNILNNCLIPLFEDLHSNYLITTWIIGLLRIYFGKKKTSKYSEKYKDFMISLIAVTQRIQNTATTVWNCIDIDTQQFPRNVPKISSIALLDIYPPSSVAPNLSAFNRELTNHFLNIINQQKNNKVVIKQLPIKREERTLTLQRAKTEKNEDTHSNSKKHKRSKSHNYKNSKTPPPRKTTNIFYGSSPNLNNDHDLFPDIDPLQITPSQINKIDEKIEEEEEEKNSDEELSFRPLSRSLSSETNMLSRSASNPFATFASLPRNMTEDIFKEEPEEHSSAESQSQIIEEKKEEINNMNVI